MRIDISSQPCALLGFNDRMIFKNFSSEIVNSVRGGAEGIMFCGIALPVSIVVHYCIKYSSKISAFAVTSNINEAPGCQADFLKPKGFQNTPKMQNLV